MRKLAPLIVALSLLAAPALAEVLPFPPAFKTQTIKTNGTQFHVRVGGTGPAVLLLHGYGETGDMWAPKLSGAEALAVEGAHFVDCIVNGKVPTTDGQLGLRVVETIEACHHSMRRKVRRNGETVNIEARGK